jgi:tetratricopeptide (TPR) repeat protein
MKAFAHLLAGIGLGIALGFGPSCVSKTSPDDSPLIAAGREKLDAGEIDAALELFEQAARADDHSLQTRMWVLRSWIELGRNNDTLDELDALVDEGYSGPELDYLFGMAFARRAQDHVALGVTDSSIKMNFEDAIERLEVAVRADEELFSDAFEPLAQAALYTREFERARRAAKKAVEHYPDDPHAWLTYGRVSLSLFKVEQEVEPWGTRAERQWAAAEEAFRKAIAAFGHPVDDADTTAAADQASLAQAAIDHGNTLMWKQLREEAADAYALAATWSPDDVNYVQIRGIFDAPDRETGAPGPDSARGKQTEMRTFNRACEGGAQGFVEVFGAEDPRGMALFWWLGYSRLELGNYAGAEEAFLITLDKDPGANSWFYLSLARYLRQANELAIEALARGWEADPAAIVTEMKLDPENHIARLEVLTGWAHAEGRLLDCALLSEICAETALKDARHWHNLGIFLRDELQRIDEESEQLAEEQLAELGQRALGAHMRALALTPDDPQVVNDTAVVMHYYVKEDLPVALELYEHAIEMAAKRLAEEDLAETERARIEAARDEAVKNRDKLASQLDG